MRRRKSFEGHASIRLSGTNCAGRRRERPRVTAREGRSHKNRRRPGATASHIARLGPMPNGWRCPVSVKLSRVLSRYPSWPGDDAKGLRQPPILMHHRRMLMFGELARPTDRLGCAARHTLMRKRLVPRQREPGVLAWRPMGSSPREPEHQSVGRHLVRLHTSVAVLWLLLLLLMLRRGMRCRSRMRCCFRMRRRGRCRMWGRCRTWCRGRLGMWGRCRTWCRGRLGMWRWGRVQFRRRMHSGAGRRATGAGAGCASGVRAGCASGVGAPCTSGVAGPACGAASGWPVSAGVRSAGAAPGVAASGCAAGGWPVSAGVRSAGAAPGVPPAGWVIAGPGPVRRAGRCRMIRPAGSARADHAGAGKRRGPAGRCDRRTPMVHRGQQVVIGTRRLLVLGLQPRGRRVPHMLIGKLLRRRPRNDAALAAVETHMGGRVVDDGAVVNVGDVHIAKVIAGAVVEERAAIPVAP